MSKPIINQRVLMSGAEYFRVEELNPYSNKNNQPDVKQAIEEHIQIKKAFEDAGIEVIKIDAPKDCQDGIYTANWGLCYRGKVVLSSLPNKRQPEEPFAKSAIEALGYSTIKPPYHFSGQGDALACGDFLFVGSVYRTDPKMHSFLEEELNCQVIGVQTIPQLNQHKIPVVNKITGWPDSFFYDLDLAISIITPDLIAWCPEAMTIESRKLILDIPIEKIEVSITEAEEGFACNLVSTGETVIMSKNAPNLKQAIESYGLSTITPSIIELSKGGGYIRCSSLSLD